MGAPILSVSAAPYDGYAFPRVLESLALCSVRYVEPAFIVGYTEPFDESAFSPASARRYAGWLSDSGIGCHAFSSHIDLGRADAVEVFFGRMDFAARLGAKVINTNAAARANAIGFFRNIPILARRAEELGMIIGLENPGDGSDNLLNTAQDGIDLLGQIGHPCVRLNYDAGNTISHRPASRPGGVDPVRDALLAMPSCGHVHIKDVRADASGYVFTPLGQGDIDCGAILRAAGMLSLSIEMPLRLSRGPDAKPRRASAPVPISRIEAALKASLEYVEQHLATSIPSKESV
jgi:sugar phosphate isomerase/epimerase